MPFWLLFIGLSMVLLRRNRGFAAGLVLALCGIKFHLFLLVPVFLLARRASRMAAGLCVGGVLLIVGCFALFGRDWPSQYYTCIVENQKHLPFTGSFLALVTVPWWPVVVCVAVGALCYAVCRYVKSPEAALSSAVALSLLIAPRFYLYDAVIALPALLLIFRRLLYAPESEQFQAPSATSEISQDLDALLLSCSRRWGRLASVQSMRGENSHGLFRGGAFCQDGRSRGRSRGTP